MNSPRNLERVVGSVVIGTVSATLSFFVTLYLLFWLGLRSGFLSLHLFVSRPYIADQHEQVLLFGSLIVSCCVFFVSIWHGVRSAK